MSRKLATIQTIKSLEKIEGKDRILYASFESVGFRVIVSVDQKVGDKVVYCEVDSLLPVRPEFEFLRARCYNAKFNGFRIRNMKMSNLYSEGLVLPVSMAPGYEAKEDGYEAKEDGYDVTEVFGITKYDPEFLEEMSNTSGSKKSPVMSFLYRNPKLLGFLKFFGFMRKESSAWPFWAQKSDETRAQNLPYIFSNYQNKAFIATEKIDGQSCLYGIYRGKFVVCSRNINLTKQSKAKSNYWDYAKLHKIEEKLRKMRKEIGEDFYIQGELAGPGIQGNKYAFPERRFFVFNIKAIKTNSFLSYDAIKYWAKRFDFEAVPYLETFIWNFRDMSDLLEFADGYSVFGDKVLREGVVIRSIEVAPPDRGQSNMLSFKVISPSFDIKWSSK